jgi:hypothetical protein
MTLFIFRDAIRFTFKSGDTVLFKSFLSRDTCFSFILSRMIGQGMLQQTVESLQKTSYKEAAQNVATKLKVMSSSRTKIPVIPFDEPKSEDYLSPPVFTESEKSIELSRWPGCYDSAAWSVEI